MKSLLIKILQTLALVPAMPTFPVLCVLPDLEQKEKSHEQSC